jgi:hypothetical protein
MSLEDQPKRARKVEHVEVKFKMRRERKPNGNKQEFWIKVDAKNLTDAVEEIKIELYQTDAGPDGTYNQFGPALTPYPFPNGAILTWDFECNDIVAVIVSYRLAGDQYEGYRWHVAASGIWKATDYYFESGKRLKDESELFN